VAANVSRVNQMWKIALVPSAIETLWLGHVLLGRPPSASEFLSLVFLVVVPPGLVIWLALAVCTYFGLAVAEALSEDSLWAWAIVSAFVGFCMGVFLSIFLLGSLGSWAGFAHAAIVAGLQVCAAMTYVYRKRLAANPAAHSEPLKRRIVSLLLSRRPGGRER
jgi:hypothetical protein